TLSDLVEQTGIHESTAKRITSHLTFREYLQRDADTRRYRLGLRHFEMGGIVLSSFSLREASAYSMSRLQSETGGTVLLGVDMQDRLVYLERREGKVPTRVPSEIGQKKPLHYGMLGILLMAYLDQEDVDRVLADTPLEAYTPFSITDRDAFSIRLEEVRKKGYCVEKGEAVEGTIGISAPIRNHTREVIAALGISLVDDGEVEDRLHSLSKAVRRSCDEISSNLGYLKV
ncbi:MAG: IclR family transcriptional regulator, partial [Deltaproteobacteria bacterium]|nr:IclR family transcriptional regulator [Deltaproteobacteria bacterium]